MNITRFHTFILDKCDLTNEIYPTDRNTPSQFPQRWEQWPGWCVRICAAICLSPIWQYTIPKTKYTISTSLGEALRTVTRLVSKNFLPHNVDNRHPSHCILHSKTNWQIFPVVYKLKEVLGKKTIFCQRLPPLGLGSRWMCYYIHYGTNNPFPWEYITLLQQWQQRQKEGCTQPNPTQPKSPWCHFQSPLQHLSV